MKHIVNLLQIIIVAAVLYPVYYVWDTDRVEGFCADIESGMSLANLEQLADERNLSLGELQKLDSTGAQWKLDVEAKSTISTFKCEVKGAGKVVASARILEEG